MPLEWFFFVQYKRFNKQYFIYIPYYSYNTNENEKKELYIFFTMNYRAQHKQYETQPKLKPFQFDVSTSLRYFLF